MPSEPNSFSELERARIDLERSGCTEILGKKGKKVCNYYHSGNTKKMARSIPFTNLNHSWVKCMTKTDMKQTIDRNNYLHGNDIKSPQSFFSFKKLLLHLNEASVNKV